MAVLRLLLAQLRALFRRDAVAGEIREEMQFHLDQRAEEYQRTGLKADEAARAANRRFGNFTLMQERGWPSRRGSGERQASRGPANNRSLSMFESRWMDPDR